MPVLADIIKPGLDVVFVGTSVGERSAREAHYYSDPCNSFYRDVRAGGITGRLLGPEEDERLLEHGIGLTDLARDVVSSDDRALSESNYDRDRLEELIRVNMPRAVCFNGKRAYEAWAGSEAANWGLQKSRTVGGVAIFVVPSTSGRVRADRKFGGRTRREWFRVLKAWLDGEVRGEADASLRIV